MQDKAEHGQRAQTQSRVAREPIPLTKRLAYSPAEFAALFGRSATWGYRQIYAGRVKPIADCGRLLVPQTEVDSILARRREYNPTRTSLLGKGQPGTPVPTHEAGCVRKPTRFDKIATTSTRRNGQETGGKQ
jgi:hypothetical protein